MNLKKTQFLGLDLEKFQIRYFYFRSETVTDQQDKTAKNNCQIFPKMAKNILRPEIFNFKALRELDSVIFRADKFVTVVN